jgi:DNA-binding NtrC family response regulator
MSTSHAPSFDPAGEPPRIIGKDPRLRYAIDRARTIAPTGLPVLVTGETGTGKELITRLIHHHSRRDRLVAVNSAAIPSELLESEMFGHQEGAFTGAVRDKTRMIERAHGGTLFLDEIGDLPRALQAKLLRALDQGEVRRIGSEVPRAVDARIVAATRWDLARGVEEGWFGADLYYRLKGTRIELPPLRDRTDDVPLLARAFAKTAGGAALCPEAVARLATYDWPGNVRELAHAIQAATAFSGGGEIRCEHMPEEIRNQSGRQNRSRAGEPRTLDEITRAAIVNALEVTGGNKSAAARTLGIDRKRIARMMKKYCIDG